jgi:hypothetical protein
VIAIRLLVPDVPEKAGESNQKAAASERKHRHGAWGALLK